MEDDTIRLQYIIENETELEERQVLRKISYQGGSYRQQLESGVPVYGIIAIVIAWTGKTSRIPLNLHSLLLKNGVPSEHLNQIDYYLNEGNFDRRRKQKIIHLEALCDLMEVLTGDTRFTELAKQFYENHQKGEKVMMCEYLNQLEERGEINGETNLSSLLEKLYDLGRDEEAKLAVRNPDARARMYKEFSIPNYRDKNGI